MQTAKENDALADLIPHDAQESAAKLQRFKRCAARSAAGYTFQYLYAAYFAFQGLLEASLDEKGLEGKVVKWFRVEGYEDVDIGFTDDSEFHLQLKWCYASDDKEQREGLRKALRDAVAVFSSEQGTHYWGFQTTQLLCPDATQWENWKPESQPLPSILVSVQTILRNDKAECEKELRRVSDELSGQPSQQEVQDPEGYNQIVQRLTKSGMEREAAKAEARQLNKEQRKLKKESDKAAKHVAELRKKEADCRRQIEDLNQQSQWVSDNMNLRYLPSRFKVRAADNWHNLQQKISTLAVTLAGKFGASPETVHDIASLLQVKVWENVSQVLPASLLVAEANNVVAGDILEAADRRTVQISALGNMLNAFLKSVLQLGATQLKEKFKKDLEDVKILTSTDPNLEYINFVRCVTESMQGIVQKIDESQLAPSNAAEAAMYVMARAFQTSKDVPPPSARMAKNRVERSKQKRDTTRKKQAYEAICSLHKNELNSCEQCQGHPPNDSSQ